MIRSRTFGILLALGFGVLVCDAVSHRDRRLLQYRGGMEQHHKIAQTYAVIDQLSELTVDLKDAETGQRGYLLTGNDIYSRDLTGWLTTSIYNVIKQLCGA